MNTRFECPNCGSPLPEPGGQATLVCQHCQSTIQVQAQAAPSAASPSPAAPGPEARKAQLASAMRGSTPVAPMSNRGCLKLILAGLAFVLFLCGGCGAYAQTTPVYGCAMRQLAANATVRDLLGEDVKGGYLVLSPSLSQSVAFDGTPSVSMVFFTPLWGRQGLGLAYVEAASHGGLSAPSMRATLFKDFQRHVISNWQFFDCQS